MICSRCLKEGDFGVRHTGEPYKTCYECREWDARRRMRTPGNKLCIRCRRDKPLDKFKGNSRLCDSCRKGYVKAAYSNCEKCKYEMYCTIAVRYKKLPLPVACQPELTVSQEELLGGLVFPLDYPTMLVGGAG